jgi:hypothetical protein
VRYRVMVFGLTALVVAGLACFLWIYAFAPDTPPSQVTPTQESDSPAQPIARFGRIVGVLLDQDEVPLANATLSYRLNDGPSHFSSTNAEGIFRLTALEGGVYTFSVQMKEDRANIQSLRPEKVELKTGERLEALRLRARVARQGGVLGRLLDLEGKGIAGAPVECVEALERKTTTIEEGAFSFRFPRETGEVTLMINRGNYGGRMVEGVEIGTEDLDVTVERGGLIRGRVRHAEDKAPVDDFSIRVEVLGLWTEEYCLPEWQADFSNQEGRFSLDAMAPGRMQVSVEAPGFAPLSLEAEVHNGEKTNLLLFELAKSSGIHGVVLDAESGQAIAEARIYQDALPEMEYGIGHIAQTDSRGRFQLNNVEAGPLSLWVAPKTAYHPQEFSVDTRRSPLMLELQPGARLHGYVSYQGEGVEGAAVTAYRRSEDNERFIIFRKRTDKEGYYEFTTLSEGSYNLEAANHLNSDDLFRRAHVKIVPGQDLLHDFEF